jgi:hypothetical protein
MVEIKKGHLSVVFLFEYVCKNSFLMSWEVPIASKHPSILVILESSAAAS